ncbi:molybdenum cofactor guanylyltransferase [Methylomonas sp. SURF-2]|uniref:Molybdenum cofactor guanylyltransferase n=1 Tax=Methylomonas subterranea TaxID=2952225 RepID=A0ABT1TL32_9GAMM|nr:molybdenum cofactor guanylyltransferase MobA [Methylomonas sp. SURF-2]MCQ8106184.1 molybdenum cofactor guanylyltransferase [Methylomonas sp. SURF-2]
MSGQNKVSGLVLAGGMAKRMAGRDKGLLLFKDRPLVAYALEAMEPLTDELFISANRNLDQYQRFGFRVIGDGNADFDGPLAGMLAAMRTAHNSLLLVMPCDSPLLVTAHAQYLLAALTDEFDVAVAFDGRRLHPVFAAIRTNLQADLRDYLARGERKLQDWFERQRLLKVDFSAMPDIFANINTAEELADLERRVRL